MSDYISKSDVIKIIEKAIENSSDFLQHDTQIDIMFEVQELPTIDEKEIIRKAFERVLEKFEDYTMWKKDMIYDLTPREHMIVKQAIKIVKEECGISE